MPQLRGCGLDSHVASRVYGAQDSLFEVCAVRGEAVAAHKNNVCDLAQRDRTTVRWRS